MTTLVGQEVDGTVSTVGRKSTGLTGVEAHEAAGYSIVQRELVWLRMHGVMPWGWIADHTRWMRKPRTWRDPAEALATTAALYRKALWADSRPTLPRGRRCASTLASSLSFFRVRGTSMARI